MLFARSTSSSGSNSVPRTSGPIPTPNSGKDDFDEKAQTFFNDFQEQPSLADVVVDQIGSGQVSLDIIDRDVIQRNALFADLDFLADIEVRVKYRREMRKNR